MAALTSKLSAKAFKRAGRDVTAFANSMRHAMGGRHARDKDTGEMRKETWVRICVLTDNIGAVELTFRVYDENQLDMRFYFSQKDTANEFRRYVNELRSSLKDLTLNIGEVRIGSVGEKMM